MRKINGKLLLGLLLGTLVLTGSVFGVHHFQYQRIAAALLWQAGRAEEQGQAERLALYLQRYLEFNPRDDGAKERLARAWARDEFEGRPKLRGRAVRLLDEVLNRDGERPELRRLAVKLALEVYNLKVARGHLEKLLPWDDLKRAGREGRDKARGELEGYWAQLLEAEKRPVEAMDCCRRARAHDPEGQESYVRLAWLLRRQKEDDPQKRAENLAEAGRVLDELVKNNEPSYKAYLARWRYRREFDLLALHETDDAGKYALTEAAEDVAQALKRAPEQVDVLLAAADVARLKGQAALEDAKLAKPERERLLAEQRQEASRYLERGLELRQKQGKRDGADPARFQLLWHKAALLLDELKRLDGEEKPAPDRETRKRGLEAQAAEAIEQVRKDRQLPAAADFLQGRLLVHRRRWAEAAALFEQAAAQLATQPDLAAQANLYLGQCYEQLEEPNAMYNAYKRVAEWDPNSAAALLGMGSALWAQGRPADAMVKYREVVARSAVPPKGWLDVARLEMEVQGQRTQPDWAAAEKYITEAAKANKGSCEVALLRAELLLRQGKAEDAEALLKEAKRKQPGAAELWAALADLAARRNARVEARKLLDEAERTAGDTVLLRLARARLMSGKPVKEVAGTLAKLAEGSERFGEEERGRLLSGLADAQHRVGNLEEARKLWQDVARLPGQRTNLRLRLLLFDLALKLGDEPGMDQALQEVRAVERTSGAFSNYGRALKLIWLARHTKGDGRGQLDEARLLLDRVLAQRPAWPAVFLARAEIAEMTGNPERAVEELQEAVKNGENSPAALRRLAELQDRLGRSAEAETTLKRLPEALLTNPDFSRVAAGVSLHTNNLNRALELARASVKEGSKDPRDLLWMGQLLAAAGKAPEAEGRLREAVKVGPGETAAWLTLVKFLAYRDGKGRDEALAVISLAEAKLPADKKALTLAQCYEAIAAGKEAEEKYKEALAERPDDATVVAATATYYLHGGRVQEAEPLLRKIASGQVKAQPAQAERARLGLAVVLANGTDYRRFREALDLVGVKLDAQGKLAPDTSHSQESTEHKRCKARVLATQSQKQFRARAVELLQELQRGGALLPDDRFVLGVLYDADGNWPAAAELVRDLTRLPAPTPRHLAWYVMGLLRQKSVDLSEAERCVQRLQQLERGYRVRPNHFASVELQARLLEANGRGDEALKLLREHLAGKDAPPEEGLLLHASLRRQKRYAEAFAECEKVWREGRWPPEVAGSVSVGLLRVMKPTDAQCRQVENWLKAASRARPDSVVLRMHLADLYDQRGRYDEAEAAYREVLAKEPGNFVALNNLAWLLALRKGDAAEAERFVNEAIANLGRRGDLLDTRGVVRLALGRPESAISDLQDAAADSESPTRLFHLARAHHLARDRVNATRVLTRARQRGLAPDLLHPVEQEACRKLLAELNVP
jgi:tetratricopeptide (TPR) repeat protein